MGGKDAYTSQTWHFYKSINRILKRSTVIPNSFLSSKWLHHFLFHNSETAGGMIYTKQRIKKELSNYNYKQQENITDEVMKPKQDLEVGGYGQELHDIYPIGKSVRVSIHTKGN